MIRQAIVVGGGFYGLRIALHLAEDLHYTDVLVLEANAEVMKRASYVNQARVHNGYHYPRSILTGHRSRVNSGRFMEEFATAIDASFEHYYGVARRFSKTNTRQFVEFADRIGAPIQAAPDHVKKRFDPRLIENVLRVHEPAFNSEVIRELLLERISTSGAVEVRTGSPVMELRQQGSEVVVRTDTAEEVARYVIIAVYSNLNRLAAAARAAPFPLQHELTEMALVEVPEDWSRTALTIMDGPFFSIMPFPPRGLHTLSHVRYTPHARWRNESALPRGIESQRSAFVKMHTDVVRYVPSLGTMHHVDSIWETKTVLADRDQSDSRPILFRPDHGVRNTLWVMGGKLDNVYDALEEMSSTR